MNEEFNNIIRKRRSVFPRQFNGEIIDDLIINEILINANTAPTHKITQPWLFKVFSKASKIELANEILKLKFGEDIPENEKKLFLDEYNIKIGGLSKLIEKSYEILNLITYYTAGPEESRAWSIIRDTKAPNAAGKIHTDFEKGFIRAEIIEYEDFIKCGSEEESKSKGLMRSEGKDYLVKDGDIIHFRYNV